MTSLSRESSASSEIFDENFFAACVHFRFFLVAIIASLLMLLRVLHPRVSLLNELL
jgi:hypothetical protein